MFTFRALFLWIHVITVVCWIGGIIFSTFIAGPILSGKSAQNGGVQFHERIVYRFYRLSRELVFVILITGIFNLVNRGILVQFNFSSTYLIVLGVKFTILMVIAGLQMYYSLKLIPVLSEALLGEQEGNEVMLTRLRKQAFGIASLMMIFGITAIYLGLNLGYV